ncbi:MAG: damage-inducible protein DinB [Crocinitomicaceae bacterium]|nr:damage-inducible protein DinB [Crocinitomicaceae bacterium]
MKAFFEDIFEFHHVVNQKMIHHLIENDNQLTEKIHLLISHSLNAQQIWNARILGGTPVEVFKISPLRDCITFDKENYKTTLQILEEEDLKRKIAYANSKGDQFGSTVQEILYHVGNHFTHHRGQLLAKLRSVGVEPIITDYIFYRR